ncbi:UvrD-helicase domain-containing protein [Adhaeribacter soli]|uniref:AAA family ATPase n=1 Tax=Adhaeribacter soli TaxID=2607655 RepID=A0A5N1IWA3_9BACT|nr:UvrD-helicase domain-containing protein [Adhaeribacter soli]KAA9338795.1 AAA family ATPase [Adhaeribacter soli]
MVKERLEPEVESIFHQISLGKNFLLSGGAGSGKTYSLVHVIKGAIEIEPTAQIACITYTNAAVKEIESRIMHPNLTVLTIHDFLWDCIKQFQKELRQSLIRLINDPDSKIKIGDELADPNFFDHLSKGIQYKEWTRIKEGIISHDEVIELAHTMFRDYKVLCEIIKDKFPFIFIDEYQDTHPSVVAIFLEHLAQSQKKNVIGFFGDAMQSIYDDSIGNLGTYLAENKVVEIQKKQNRRNPNSVILLANQLRSDGLEQEPSQDQNAPNMRDGFVKDGNIKFIYSNSSDLSLIKKSINWDFGDVKQTKELNLTHNLIAPQAGFAELMEIYDRDKILEFKSKVTSHIRKEKIDKDFSEYTFGQVVDELSITPTPGQKEFIQQNPDLMEAARNSPFSQFSKIYVDKDALIDDKKQDESEESKRGSKRDNLIKHLFKIQLNITLYKANKFNEFIQRTEYPINCFEDKAILKRSIETLDSMEGSSIEEVISFADKQNICKIDDKLTEFIHSKTYVYNRVKVLPFSEFQNLFNYLEGHTPFSTQHKIKGEEYDNVLVIMDSGGWNKYNFEYVFSDTIYSSLTPAKKKTYSSIKDRSQKILYVCCTRAKENLVVYYNAASPAVIEKAKQWFGEQNVKPI